jgi:hypothetical protein
MARAASPFIVLLPAVIWWQTHDAFFAGVAAWAVTLVVLATESQAAHADAYALAGGVLFGVTAFLSYGLVLMALIPVVVAYARGHMRPIVLAAIGSAPVFVAFAALGFSWLDGLGATRHQYWAGVASQRPYTYFLVANLALFALALGPAVAVGIAHVRESRVWLLVGSVFAVVAIADLSGMSKAEVERIWLPFVPWAALAVGPIAARSGLANVRRLLILQASSTIVLAVTVQSWW